MFFFQNRRRNSHDAKSKLYPSNATQGLNHISTLAIWWVTRLPLFLSSTSGRAHPLAQSAGLKTGMFGYSLCIFSMYAHAYDVYIYIYTVCMMYSKLTTGMYEGVYIYIYIYIVCVKVCICHVYLVIKLIWCLISIYVYGSIPIDTFLVGWTSICQLVWGSLGTRVLTHSHISIITSRSKNPIRWVSNWPKVCSRPVLFFDAARRWLRLLQILFRS